MSHCSSSNSFALLFFPTHLFTLLLISLSLPLSYTSPLSSLLFSSPLPSPLFFFPFRSALPISLVFISPLPSPHLLFPLLSPILSSPHLILPEYTMCDMPSAPSIYKRGVSGGGLAMFQPSKAACFTTPSFSDLDVAGTTSSVSWLSGLTWNSAQTECSSWGGNLVSINSAKQMAFVSDLVQVCSECLVMTQMMSHPMTKVFADSYIYTPCILFSPLRHD